MATDRISNRQHPPVLLRIGSRGDRMVWVDDGWVRVVDCRDNAQMRLVAELVPSFRYGPKQT